MASIGSPGLLTVSLKGDDKHLDDHLLFLPKTVADFYPLLENYLLKISSSLFISSIFEAFSKNKNEIFNH